MCCVVVKRLYYCEINFHFQVFIYLQKLFPFYKGKNFCVTQNIGYQ